MVRLELLEILLGMHLQRIHKCFDDAVFRLDIGLCNETRFVAVGSLSIPIFIFLIGIINYYYVCFKTMLENLNNS